MRKSHSSLLLLMAAVLAMPGAARAVAQPVESAAPERFGEILKRYEIPAETVPLDPAIMVSAYAAEDAPDIFCLAYRPSGAEPDSLDVALLNRQSRSWRHERILARGTTPQGLKFVAGLPTRVRHTLKYLYIDTRLNPSAGLLLVLSRDGLELQQVLSGWSAAVLPDDTVVYEESHLGPPPAIPLQLSMFSPRTGRDVLLYPRRPFQMFRQRYLERVKDLYERRPPEWFAANGYSSDVERFDSSLAGGVIVGEGGRFIGFVVQFGRQGAVLSPPIERGIVTCRVDGRDQTIPCQEDTLDAMRARFPGIPDDEVVRLLVKERSGRAR